MSDAWSISGREMLERMRAGTLPAAPFARLLGFTIEEIAEGRVTFTAQPTEEAYNPLGLVHGGWIATILDSAIGTSLTTLMPPGKSVVSLDLAVRYFKPLTAASGIVRCEGSVINIGRNYGTGEARLVDAAGRIHAHATSTCAIITPRERE
jgi:uncharacterized protein (TIGR00369 family)